MLVRACCSDRTLWPRAELARHNPSTTQEHSTNDMLRYPAREPKRHWRSSSAHIECDLEPGADSLHGTNLALQPRDISSVPLDRHLRSQREFEETPCGDKEKGKYQNGSRDDERELAYLDNRRASTKITQPRGIDVQHNLSSGPAVYAG